MLKFNIVCIIPELIIQGYTPHRPQSARAEKVVIPVRGENRPEHSDTAGAGDELAAALKRANSAL